MCAHHNKYFYKISAAHVPGHKPLFLPFIPSGSLKHLGTADDIVLTDPLEL